jgi:ribosome recycling factor
MINDITNGADKRMDKAVEALRVELTKLRAGRAHPSLLDHVKVDYYGSEVPLSQAANINVQDARTLSVQPWDKTMVKAIEKAILNSDLGLNPASSGDVIRIPLPALNEERRKELIKVVRHEGESARVAIRNVRRDANQQLKNLVKDKEISEDDERRGEERIQHFTDAQIKRIDELVAQKEKDLLEI